MWSFLSGGSSSALLHRSPEFPLQELQDAIATRDEAAVRKVLRKRRIRNELLRSTTTHKVPRDPQQQKCNVFTCVQAAARHNLPHVVLAMHQFNPTDVRLATWYALYRLQKSGQQVQVSRDLVQLARAQRRAWLWDRIGALLLLRQSTARANACSSTVQERHIGVHPLAVVPDEAFTIILSFVDLHEDREARLLKFLIEARPCPACARLCVPGDCKAKRLRKMERRASKRLSSS